MGITQWDKDDLGLFDGCLAVDRAAWQADDPDGPPRSARTLRVLLTGVAGGDTETWCEKDGAEVHGWYRLYLPRWYDWPFIGVTDPAVTYGGGPHWLLIRRRISDGEYAFYRAHAPRPVPLAQLVRVAGSRWKIQRRQPARRPADPVDPQRDPQALHRIAPAAARARQAAALVTMATPSPGHRPSLPLPAARPRTRMITS